MTRRTARLVMASVAVIALLVAALFLPEHVMLLLSPLGMALGATVVQQITEATTPEEHKVRDVSNVLTRIRPSLAPIDTILRLIGTESAQASKIEWAESEVLPHEDTVTSAVEAGSAGASVTVPVATPALWRKDDIAMVVDGSGNMHLLLVANVSGNNLTVYELTDSGFGTVPALSANQKIYRVTTAKPEFSMPGSGRATMPVYKFNYTQIYEGVIEISGTRAATRNYTQQHDMARAEEEQLWDYRLQIEYSTIFGLPSNITDPATGQPRRTAAGIRYFISSNVIPYNNSTDPLDESKLMDVAYAVFAGQVGSQTKYLVASAGLQHKIDKILLNSSGYSELQATREVSSLGLHITTVRTGFGNLRIIYHEGLARMGKQEWGLIIDPRYIRRRVLRPMSRKDVTPPGLDGRIIQWLEESTLEVRYEKAHGILYNADTDVP